MQQSVRIFRESLIKEKPSAAVSADNKLAYQEEMQKFMDGEDHEYASIDSSKMLPNVLVCKCIDSMLQDCRLVNKEGTKRVI